MARRLSQEELAERAKMSAAAISALERGSRQAPYRSSVDLLADGLGIDAEARDQLHASAEHWRKARALPARALPSPGSPNNLPLQLTSFVGRLEERTDVETLLRKCRLVTLTGAGGIGKTRLALHVAAQMLSGFPDGVWLVDLAPLTDASLVPNAIAAVLGVQESPSRPLLEILNVYLRGRALLLILDNCEHVLAAVANTVDSILRAAARVSVLATSVEALGISGEHLYRTPSLGAPASKATRELRAQDALTYPSIALFVDRAEAASVGFKLTDDSAPIVANICKRLDGIALAIELAAARVNIMPVKILDEKLDERFRLLRRGNRAGPHRQQTLHALIEWSHELLSEQERVLFRRLAIFAGGFTLDLATAVATDGDIHVLDLLPSLAEKSLVQTEITDGNPRYRLLESTRLYAREKLVEHGELDAVARAHATGYLALSQQLSVDFETMPDHEWKALAEPELENWRAALEWSLGFRRDVPIGQCLAAALTPLWASHAAVEGRRWVHLALETVDEETPPAVAASLNLAEANIAMYLTLWNAMLAAAHRAVNLFDQADDPSGATEGRIIAGRALALLGDAQRSEALLEPSVDACTALGRPRLTGMALESLAMARMTAGDVASARPLYARALSLFEAIGAEQSLSNVTANLAGAEFRGGDADTALRLATEAVVKYQALNNPREVLVLCNIAAYLVALGRLSEAREYAWKGLNLAVERQMEVQLTWALQHLAAVAALRDYDDEERVTSDRRRAAQILGFVDARLAALDTPRKFTEQQERTALLAALCEGIGPDELSTLLAEGATWSDQQALAQAHAI